MIRSNFGNFDNTFKQKLKHFLTVRYSMLQCFNIYAKESMFLLFCYKEYYKSKSAYQDKGFYIHFVYYFCKLLVLNYNLPKWHFSSMNIYLPTHTYSNIDIDQKDTRDQCNVAINSVTVVHNRLYEAFSWIRITKTPFHYTPGTYVYVSSPYLPTLFTKHRLFLG